jgi:hypothetical protein
MDYDIFIGYSRLDAKAAEAVQESLEKAGLRCYRDVTHVTGGGPWRTAITEAIRNSHAYLALLSEHSVASHPIAREIAVASESSKQVIPVLLGRDLRIPDEILFSVIDLQHINAEPSLTSALDEIVSTALRRVDPLKNKDAYDAEADVRARSNFVLLDGFAKGCLGLPNGEADGYEAVLNNGSWIVASRTDNYWGHLMGSLPQISEFVVEISLQKLEGADQHWFGVEFGKGWPNDYYQFAVNGQHSVKFAQRKNETWVEGPRTDAVMKSESGNSLKLKVVRRECTIHIFAGDLHAVSVEDCSIRNGLLGVVWGPGMRVRYSKFQLHAINPSVVFENAMRRWERLEMKEAREFLEYASRFGSEQDSSTATELLKQTWPDRRETVLIAIGAGIDAQLHDRDPAFKLTQQINRKGKKKDFRWSAIVTDSGLLDEPKFLDCPVISVGGPVANKITADFQRQLPTDERCEARLKVQHNFKDGDRRISVWGQTGKDTSDAVDFLISSGILDEFLSLIWK